MKKSLIYMFLITLTFSQSEEKSKNYIIETFCKTPNEGKMNFDVNYSYSPGKVYFDSNGDATEIGTLFFYKNLESEINNQIELFYTTVFNEIDVSQIKLDLPEGEVHTSIDTIKALDSLRADIPDKFRFLDGNGLSESRINLNFDYFGANGMGVYANVDINVLKNRLISSNKTTINFDFDDSLHFNEDELIINVNKLHSSFDLKIGTYKIWKEIFEFQKLKSDFHLILSKNKKGLGGSFSFDYYLSSHLSFSNKSLIKSIYIANPYSIVRTFFSANNKLLVAVSDSLSYPDSLQSTDTYSSIINSSRLIYNKDKLTILLDMIYYLEKNVYMNGVDDFTQLSGNALILRPEFSYLIINNQKWGNMNIDNISFHVSFLLPLLGNEIVNKAGIQFYTKIRFN